MKAEPAPICPRDLLGFSKKSHEKQQDQIGIDAGLELEVAGEILRSDLALSGLELQRGVQRMIDLLHKRDERPDVAIAQAGARIVALELFDQPARIVDSDVKLIVGVPQKGARQFAQLPRGRARQPREMRAAAAIDQAILEVDSDLGIGPFEEPLDLAEERFVHDKEFSQVTVTQRVREAGLRFTTAKQNFIFFVPFVFFV